MRGHVYLYKAALAAAFAFLFTMSSPATAQLSDEQRQQFTANRDTPLIGGSLMDAASTRFSGNCYLRQTYLARASDDLAFYRRYHRVKGDTPNVDENKLNAAQRALDREKRRKCEPSQADREYRTQVANLPALTGAVDPMPQTHGSDAPLQDRFEEIDSALREIFSDTDNCDLETARRWMENYRRLLQELRLKRDAALAAGDLSTTDPWRAHTTALTMRSIVEVAQASFDEWRLNCAKKARGETQVGLAVPVLDGLDGLSGEYAKELPGFYGKELPGDYGKYAVEVEPVSLERYEPFIVPDDASQAMLDAHNVVRWSYSLPPLKWDPYLAYSAHTYAQQLIGTGQIRHSPREGREEQRENLLITNRGFRSPTEMIVVWIEERQFYIPGTYPDVSTTGDWYPVSHFTQVVWPWTSHVGCAISSDADWDYTVCRYTAPGNRDGDPLELELYGGK